jgi:hypothetical protein
MLLGSQGDATWLHTPQQQPKQPAEQHPSWSVCSECQLPLRALLPFCTGCGARG